MEGKKLCKRKDQAKISGVCAGLAEYFVIDVTIIRLIWAIAIIMGVGSPILIYFLMAIILPDYDPDSVPYEDYDERY